MRQTPLSAHRRQAKSLAHRVLLGRGDNVKLDQKALERKGVHDDRRIRRPGGTEVAFSHGQDTAEESDVGQINRYLEDSVDAGSGSLESPLNVGHGLGDLCVDVANTNNLSLLIDAGLSRQENQIADNVALANHVNETGVG